MSRFHSLPIAKVEKETRDAVAITFAVPDALRDEFRYEPGQHLTLKADIAGKDVRRSYSICSAKDDGVLRIAVKRAPGGVFSNWANESLRAGDALEVMPPMGHFNAPLDEAARHHYVGFAAGSGITPVLSLIKTLLRREPGTRCTLVYGNRRVATMMFKEELEDLKDRYLNRFTLLPVFSREAQDAPLFNGRLDEERIGQFLKTLVPADSVDEAFACGPAGMLDGAVAALAAAGVPSATMT